jgi:succinoglycan biosynthesis transport protein ExoP
MSFDLQVRPRPDHVPDVPVPYVPLNVELRSEEQPSIFARVHRIFRGKYLWALLLTVVLAAPAAYLGYWSQTPMYASTGIIHIQPNRPYLIEITAEAKTEASNYTSFRNLQATLVRYQRIIDEALRSETWRALGRDMSTDTAWQEFARNLTATVPPGNETVLVTFTDPQPEACTRAVKSVLEAYHRLFVVEGDQKRREDRINALEANRLSLQAERDNIRESIRNAVALYGTDNLAPLVDSRQREIDRMQEDIAALELKLAELNLQGPAAQRQSPESLTVEEIAQVDPLTGDLYRALLGTRFQIAVKLETYGENHPQLLGLRAEERVRQRELDRAVADWRARAAAAPAAADPASRLRQQLEASLQTLRDKLRTAQKEMRDLGTVMGDLEVLRKKEADKDAVLAQFERTIESLRVESRAAPRIEILSYGDRPVLVRDERLSMAAKLGLAGALLAFGLVGLWGLVDRRFHTLDDAQTGSRLPLLGILPELPQDLADPEQAALAAHCVHQIRTLLQIGPGTGPRNAGPADRRVFAVTSPAAGTGKTSLTLALGVSFAAAGSGAGSGGSPSNGRTLIIDCDIVGGGLTARVEAIIRRRIGQIFRREGILSQQQLDTALRLAHNSQRKLGEILVELGYLSPDDVARALALQEETPIGLLDALAGEDLQACVAETGIAGLYILPLGGALPADVSRLSHRALADLLTRAREHFDTILIDTGPIPGSIEAAAVTAAADGVILVVSRGEHRPLAEKAIQYLRELGAVLAGMVFNRANDDDMQASTTATRLSSFDRSGRPRTVPEAADTKLGPIAGAVATSAPASRQGTRPHQP